MLLHLTFALPVAPGCPRGLYQYNAHLQEYHPELVQHAALQYRDDRFVRRNGSYYN
jgi:hypothetical protein